MSFRGSKLSQLLRHQPDILPMDEKGGVELTLIARYFDQTPELIRGIVSTDTKGRYEIYTRGHTEMIRAVQGHSFPVDDSAFHSIETADDYFRLIGSSSLYHGTTYQALEKIFASGGSLKPMSRQFVHFQSDMEKSRQSATRHKQATPVIIELPIVDGTPPVIRTGGILKHAANGVILSPCPVPLKENHYILHPVHR